MSSTLKPLLYWTPRLVGVAVTLFVAAFALDAFDGRPFFEAIPGFLIHLLPAGVCAAVVAAAWRFHWIGAIGFGALAVGYALMVPSRPDWIAVISGPLALTALLFALSPARRRPMRATP